MTREEYLNTTGGQVHQRYKRLLKLVRFTVYQEPKGKNSSDEEKCKFRKQIHVQLREQNRRRFRGDILLQIDYYTTKNNPPEIQTLSKNYLDLLHKEMPHIDALKSILYDDDSQIKVLISNYHIDENNIKQPRIEIKAYSMRHFLADIELVDKIISSDFSDSDYSLQLISEDIFKQKRFSSDSDYFDILADLEEGKNDYCNFYGEQYYRVQKDCLIRQIQEQFLQQNNLDIVDLLSIFQPFLPKNKKYSSASNIQNIWSLSRNMISFSPSFLKVGNAPRHLGEKKIFKDNLEGLLNEFREKFKMLFPLLHPINVIIIFIPPLDRVVDLDNLARYIIPFINKVFKPPTVVQLTYNVPLFHDLMGKEIDIQQNFPPHSVASYQLVQVPRLWNDPADGKIGVLFTDGFYHMNNIWQNLDDVIDKWVDNI